MEGLKQLFNRRKEMQGTTEETKRWGLLNKLDQVVKDAATEYKAQNEADENNHLIEAMGIDMSDNITNALTEVLTPDEHRKLVMGLIATLKWSTEVAFTWEQVEALYVRPVQ